MSRSIVSIIIPCYNRANFISRTLESIRNQTYQHWECLIVNDGSEDDTEKIALDWCNKDSRFNYFYKNNGGVSSARNHGIIRAKGAYIAFCDDDDFWILKKLEKQVDVLEKNLEYGLVTGNIEYAEKDGTKTGTIKSHKGNNHGYIFKELLLKNRTSTITPLLRREIFDKVGFFNPGFTFAEDWEFWRRVSYYYKFYFIDEVLAFVRLHDGNVTGTRNNSVLERFKLYKKLTDSLLSWGETIFNKEEKDLIRYTEWYFYRNLFANNLIGLKSKSKFLTTFLINDYKDMFRLLKLFIKYNVLFKKQI